MTNVQICYRNLMWSFKCENFTVAAYDIFRQAAGPLGRWAGPFHRWQSFTLKSNFHFYELQHCTCKLRFIKLAPFGWMESSAAVNLAIAPPSLSPTSSYPRNTTSSPAFGRLPTKNVWVFWKHFRLCLILVPLFILFSVLWRRFFSLLILIHPSWVS